MMSIPQLFSPRRPKSGPSSLHILVSYHAS
jgi:hypothetical protein